MPYLWCWLIGNKNVKYKKDGIKYKDFFYYGCKHRKKVRGHKCTFNKQIRKEILDGAVAEVITKLVSNPKFTRLIQEKINMKVDTTNIDNEIENYENELRKSNLIEIKNIRRFRKIRC